MSIRSDVEELNAIRNELKMLTQKRKILKAKEKEATKRISDFLKSKEQSGVKYQGLAILLDNKTIRKPKKKKDKETSQIALLEKSGIRNPKEFLQQLADASKEEAGEVKTNIKLRNL